MFEYSHEMINSIIFIIVLLIIYFLIKKYKASINPISESIKVDAVMPMGAKEKIAIISVLNKKIIVGITSTTINTLYIEEEGSVKN